LYRLTLSGSKWVFLGLAALGLAGCKHYRPTETGFLSDYSQLVKDPIHLNHAIGFQRAMTHDATHEAVCQVDSFYIEPVQWRVDPETRGGKDPERQAILTSKLEQALIEQLSTIKPIVPQPGPKTATIRSAITTVRYSRPFTNLMLTATLFTPVGIGPVFFGGGAIEAEAIGPDGRQMAAVTSASSGGWFDIIGFYTKAGHAKKAMWRDAKELRQALDH